MSTDATEALQLAGLLALSTRRWSIPVLAALHSSTTGLRHVQLVASLGLSRQMLRSTLAVLQSRGLVARNPGYGHPLRPEYVLTDHGQDVARDCHRVERIVDDLGVHAIAYRKWTLPLLTGLLAGHRRFAELQLALPSVTPRALTRALRDAAGSGLVCRDVDAGFPPRPDYRLSPTGTALAGAAAALCRA